MKQQRLKLPKYLAVVAKYAPNCVACGATEGVQNAHYSGLYSEKLGNGMGSKSHDYCVARLCRPCHQAMDSYANGNSAERAYQFVTHIWVTLQEVAGAKVNFVVTPNDLKEQKWLKEVATGLTWLITSDSFVDEQGLIEYLASKRNFVERNGK